MSDSNALSAPKSYKSVLELAIDVKDDDVILKKGCKLCNLSIREEAEQYWEVKQHNTASVMRFLQDRDVTIDHKSVSNHMWKHYHKQQKKMAIRDYAETLKELEAVRADRLGNISLCRQSLINELLNIGEQGSKLPLCEQRKNAELVIKLVAAIVDVDKSEKAFFEEWKPAKIVIEKLTQIVQIEAANAPLETKQLMAKVVETLYDSCEGISPTSK